MIRFIFQKSDSSCSVENKLEGGNQTSKTTSTEFLVREDDSVYLGSEDQKGDEVKER